MTNDVKYVYGCGPITGLSYEEARHGWRPYVAQELERRSDGRIKMLSPMRYKEYLKGETNLAAAGYADYALSTAKGITTRDRFDVLRSDMLFCNLLGAQSRSIGSMIEFGWADLGRVPILGVMEDEGNTHDHGMVRELAGFIVPDLDSGIELTLAMLLEGY